MPTASVWHAGDGMSLSEPPPLRDGDGSEPPAAHATCNVWSAAALPTEDALATLDVWMEGVVAPPPDCPPSLRWRYARAAERLPHLRRVAGSPSERPFRRVLAVYLALRWLAYADALPPPAPWFVQTLSEPVPRGEAAYRALTFLSGAASLPVAARLPRLDHDGAYLPLDGVQRMFRRHLAGVMGAREAAAAEGAPAPPATAAAAPPEPPPPKPHAMDAASLRAAAPFEAGGRADATSRGAFAAEVAKLEARLPALGDGGAALGPAAAAAAKRVRAAAPPPILPGAVTPVDPLLLVLEHRAFPCDRCADGTCGIVRTAAAVGNAVVPFYGDMREQAVRVAAQRPQSYPRTAAEDTLFRRDFAELAADGRMGPCAQPAVVSPTFYAYRWRYVESEAEARAILGRDPTALREHLDARARATVDAAVAGAAAGGSGGGTSRSAAFMAALAREAVADDPRLVYDYKVINWAGCPWPMAMCTVTEMLGMVYPGGYVASTDVRSGFHHVALHPASRRFCAVRGPMGDVWEPSRLMFGFRDAPAHFSVLTAEMVETVLRRVRAALGVDCRVRMAVYIDDIFIFAATESDCARALGILRDYCAAIGVQLKEGKTREPSQLAPLLGISVDTRTMSVSLPADKRYNVLFLLSLAIDAGRRGAALPIALIRKLTGKLSSIVALLPAGVARLAPLWDACSAAGSATPTAAALAALVWFRDRLSDPAAAQSRLIPSPASPDAPPWVVCNSDASGAAGFAGCMGPIVWQGYWAPGCALSIGAREFYAGALLWAEAGDLLAGMVLQQRLDNAPDVFALLKGYTDDADARPYLAAILRGAARADALVLPAWLPREANEFCDEQSKAVPAEAAAIAERFRAPRA
jgi:hypothetical protein